MFKQTILKSATPYVVPFAALTIIFELLIPCRAEGLTTAEWKEISRQAYRSVHFEHNPSKAYQEYQHARRVCALPESNQVALDLDLARVDTLLRMKKTEEAQSLLQQIGPVIERLHSRKLIAVRYWRRSVNLHLQQGLYDQAARDQRHVVDLLSNLLGEDCTDAMDERLNLLKYLSHTHEWKPFLELIAECDRIMSKRPKEAQTARLKAGIDMYLNLVIRQFKDVVYYHSPDEALELVNLYEKVRPGDRWLISLMINLLQRHTDARADLSRRILAAFHKYKPTDKEALMAVAHIRIADNVNQAFDCDVPSKKMQADLDEAYQLALKAIPEAERPGNDLYIQALALKTCMLAKSGDPEKADRMLNAFHPTAHLSRVLGILQSRREIAKAALAQKKMALAEKQFDDNIKLATEKTSGKERALLLDQWSHQRRHYMGH